MGLVSVAQFKIKLLLVERDTSAYLYLVIRIVGRFLHRLVTFVDKARNVKQKSTQKAILINSKAFFTLNIQNALRGNVVTLNAGYQVCVLCQMTNGFISYLARLFDGNNVLVLDNESALFTDGFIDVGNSILNRFNPVHVDNTAIVFTGKHVLTVVGISQMPGDIIMRKVPTESFLHKQICPIIFIKISHGDTSFLKNNQIKQVSAVF